MSYTLHVDEGAAEALLTGDLETTMRIVASRPDIVRQLLAIDEYELWHAQLTELLAAQRTLEANGGGWLTVEEAGHTVTVWIGAPGAS